MSTPERGVIKLLPGEESPPLSPPQVFLGINLLSSNFYIIFWVVIIEQLKVSIFLCRQCQHSSTLFRGHWNIKNVHEFAKISKIIRKWRILSEISILSKIIPGTKKFAKVLKNGFILSESFFESFAAVTDIEKLYEYSRFSVKNHDFEEITLCETENLVVQACGLIIHLEEAKASFEATQINI